MCLPTCPTYDTTKLEMQRSDLGDGGWSIHVRRTDVDEDEDPARAWPIVASGEGGELSGGKWERPSAEDWAGAGG